MSLSNPPAEARIEDLLPHRPPFLFVDEILACNGQDHITARLFLDPRMVFFSGHFPERAVMPGVLITEALAQTAGLLLGLRTLQASGAPDQRRAYFLARAEMKYVRPVGPGETLHLQARLTKTFGALFRFDVAAAAKGQNIAEGNLALAEQSPA